MSEAGRLNDSFETNPGVEFVPKLATGKGGAETTKRKFFLVHCDVFPAIVV